MKPIRERINDLFKHDLDMEWCGHASGIGEELVKELEALEASIDKRLETLETQK